MARPLKASPRQRLLAQLRAESAACKRHNVCISPYTAPELWNLCCQARDAAAGRYVTYQGVRFRVRRSLWCHMVLDPETKAPLGGAVA